VSLWLRMYTGTLDNLKAQSLPGELFKFWINLLLVAKLFDGKLPPLNELAFLMRISEEVAKEALGELIRRGLIDEVEPGVYQPHNWTKHQYVSDSSTPRVQKHRAKQAGNVSGREGTLVTRNVDGNVSETPQSRADLDQRESRRSFRVLASRHTNWEDPQV
jgi:hypothetical protein